MKKSYCLFLVFVLAAFIPVTAQNVYYVTAEASGAADGSSWESATSLEAAIAKTTKSSTDIILVKKGIYTAPATNGVGYFFDQKNNVIVYGNCDGTESASELPVVDENTEIETVLRAPGTSGNYEGRVVTLYKGSVTMIGFDIEGGDGAYDSTYGQEKYAGAVYIQGKGTLKYCKIHDATALSGGGLQIRPQGTDLPLLEYCEIYNNTASSTSTNTGGGGLYIAGNALLKNCIVRDNEANYFGGGLYVNAGDDVLVNNCIIKDNTAPRTGGAYFLKGTMVNCLVLRNIAKEQAAGGVNLGTGAQLINSTIVKNQVIPNVHAGGVIVNAGTVKNCIIWGNTINDGAVSMDMRLASHNTTAANVSTVSNSCYATSAGFTASHVHQPVLSDIISIDPLFNGASSDDYRLSVQSPAKDAGSNAAYNVSLYADKDLLGGQRIFGETIDMGAYELDPNAVALPKLEDREGSTLEIQYYTIGNSLWIESEEGIATVYTPAGVKYAAKTLTGKTEFILPNGVYVLVVNNLSYKVIIR